MCLLIIQQRVRDIQTNMALECGVPRRPYRRIWSRVPGDAVLQYWACRCGAVAGVAMVAAPQDLPVLWCGSAVERTFRVAKHVL